MSARSPYFMFVKEKYRLGERHRPETWELLSPRLREPALLEMPSVAPTSPPPLTKKSASDGSAISCTLPVTWMVRPRPPTGSANGCTPGGHGPGRNSSTRRPSSGSPTAATNTPPSSTGSASSPSGGAVAPDSDAHASPIRETGASRFPHGSIVAGPPHERVLRTGATRPPATGSHPRP